MSFKIGGESYEGGDFPSPEEGMHVAVCAAIYSIGTQDMTYAGVTKKANQIAIVWELATQDPEGRAFDMIQTERASTHENANFYGIAKTLLGRPIESNEEVDPDDMVGKSVMLTLVNGQKSGKPYIESVAALQPGIEGITITGSYGETDDIHRLVAWHINRAAEGTVPGGQGLMPQAKGSTDAPASNTNAAGDGPDLEDLPF